MNLFVLPLLFVSLGWASSLKVSEPKLIKGSSIGKYAKPGAPVDITYTTQNVEAGQYSEIHIELTTSAKHGNMLVSIKSDKALTSLAKIDKNITFVLNEKQKIYPVTLHMSAEVDGVYYIRLLVKIKGKGARTFAVPVYIGEGRVKKSKNVSLDKSASGENISVSKAVESVE